MTVLAAIVVGWLAGGTLCTAAMAGLLIGGIAWAVALTQRRRGRLAWLVGTGVTIAVAVLAGLTIRATMYDAIFDDMFGRPPLPGVRLTHAERPFEFREGSALLLLD